MDDRLIGRLLHPGLFRRVGGSVQQGLCPAGRVRFFQHDAILAARSSISAPPLGVVSTTRRKNMASSSTMPKISYSVGNRKKSACW